MKEEKELCGYPVNREVLFLEHLGANKIEEFFFCLMAWHVPNYDKVLG